MARHIGGLVTFSLMPCFGNMNWIAPGYEPFLVVIVRGGVL